jgi:phosphatidylinositol glycan class P protein
MHLHRAAAAAPLIKNSHRRGASSVEVYGFVGWITSAVAFALYCLWAFTPEPMLQKAGITYYPSKQWALIIPAYLIISVITVYWVYESFNMMSVVEPASVLTLHDASSKWITALNRESAAAATDRSIPPLVHIPAPVASAVLYGCQDFKTVEAEVFAAARNRQVDASLL